MVHTTVLPSAQSLTMNLMTLCAALESRPLVGSSRMRMLGLDSSSMAMLRRRFWPPDSPLRKMSPTRVSRAVPNPMASTTLSTRTSISWDVTVLGRLSLAAILMVSATVNDPSSVSSWAT